MNNTISLIPAYERGYKSKKALLEDFNNNKDFIISSIGDPNYGRYANKPDLKAYKTITFRYCNFARQAVLSR